MGGMLGFGMSLVGTAIGTAVDTLIQNTQNTGNALRGLARDVSGSFEQIKEAGLFASSAQERFVQSLIESGKVATAYAVIQDRVTQRLGIDGADRLKQAAEAGDRLNRAMNDLGVQLQLFISGPLASFLEIMAGALTQGRRVSTTGEAFDRLSPNKQKQFLDELAKANIAAGADPAKSGFIYRSVPGGAQLFSGEGKAEDKADTFKRLTSNLAPAQIQRIFAGLNPSGNKPKPLSNQEKADLAVNTAQENLTNAQALLDRVSKRNESNDILKGFKQRNLAAKREQEDLDRQSFELRRDYEKSIGDIRRGVEERIGQIQQENRQKEIEGVVKQGEIRQQQLSNSAAAIRGGLAGDQIASDLADAVTSFLSAQLSAENQLQQRRMQFEAEVANLQLETEKYKIDVARSVAQLNLNTAERIQQINRGVARRNEDAATNVFNSEKEVAALRNDVLLNELLLMRAKRLVFLEQAKVNLQADPGNPNLRLVKEAEETIIKDYDKYVDRVGEIGKSIKTMSPPPRIREVPAATTRGVSFSGVDRVANRRRQILEENMRREEELTALIKEGSKTELANRLTSGVADVRNEMSTPMTDALKSLQGATGSTRAAIQEITNSYGKLIASLASDPKIVLSAELSKLIAVSLTAREALEGLRPTYEYYTSTFGDLASKTSQVRQEISDLLSPTTEYERILKRINESGGLSAGLGEERNKELLDAAKYVDTLDKVAKFLSGLNDIAGGITDSFINFNKELFKGANLMESVAAFAEEVADKTLDVILEFTLRPIQEQLFKNMTNLLGIEAPQDPILLPLSKINTGVDSLVREAEKGFLIREPSRPGPVVAPTPGGAAAPLPPGLAPLPSGSRSSLPLGTVIGAVAGNPAQHTGMGGPGATTPQNVSPAARIQALLDMISYAEGTFRDGGRGYNIRLGGSTFDNSRPHPGTVISSGQWSSNAHGAYQFLSPTWKGVNQGQNRPMTPENQDKAAINLIQNRGVNPSAPLTQQAIARLAPEWASLPTMGGASYYGQPVKRLPDLLEFYNRRLELHNSQVAAQPAPAAPTSEQMQQRGLQAMEDFYGIVQRAGQELAKLTDGLSGIRIATEDTTVKAAEGAEKLNNSVNAFQRTTQIGLQAMSSIAMSIGGAQLIGRGGAYNVLMGAASIFGSISSITGMFGAGGSLEGVFGKKPPAAPVAGARRFGGPVFAGSQYLVGENGPELFTPSIGGTIVDNDELYVPGLDDKDSPSPSIGRYSRQGSSDTSMNNLTVPYQRNEASREIDRLEQVASNPRELPPIKYETTRINEYEFVTPEQLEASNARTAKAARNQTIRELADSMKTRKRLGIA
jgi:muramidase (phage lysozyme)